MPSAQAADSGHDSGHIHAALGLKLGHAALFHKIVVHADHRKRLRVAVPRHELADRAAQPADAGSVLDRQQARELLADRVQQLLVQRLIL